jgi:hypothetical protein
VVVFAQMASATSSIPSSSLTITLYVIEIVCCVFALVFLIFFISFIRTIAIVHRNVRILVMNQTVAFILMSVTRCTIDVGVLANVFFSYGVNSGKCSILLEMVYSSDFRKQINK